MCLGAWSPMLSGDLPGCAGTSHAGEPPAAPYSAHTSLFGLAPRGVCQATPVTRSAGGLLPHRFTLASMTPCSGELHERIGGLFSVALSVGHPLRDDRPAVSRRAALRSSDFPQEPKAAPAAARIPALPRCVNAQGRRRIIR